ncbi:hypothetical protein ABPG72_016298 [Tetrahymena utriculariae]
MEQFTQVLQELFKDLNIFLGIDEQYYFISSEVTDKLRYTSPNGSLIKELEKFNSVYVKGLKSTDFQIKKIETNGSFRFLKEEIIYDLVCRTNKKSIFSIEIQKYMAEQNIGKENMVNLLVQTRKEYELIKNPQTLEKLNQQIQNLQVKQENQSDSTISYLQSFEQFSKINFSQYEEKELTKTAERIRNFLSQEAQKLSSMH